MDTASRPIYEFQGEHRFLSNFWPARVTLDNAEYPTVEHAYQAAKFTADQAGGTTGRWGIHPGTPFTIRQLIQAARSPGLAKTYGKMWPPRAGWEEVKLVVMEVLVRQKFTGPDAQPEGQNLAALLRGTGDAELVERNEWGDRFWGVYHGRGENHLGKILMKVRKEINDGL